MALSIIKSVLLIILIYFTSNGLMEKLEEEITNEILPATDEKSLDKIDKILKKHSEVMQNFMDVTVDPCNDFYSYACGNWEKIHSIPEDNMEFNVFSALNDKLMVLIKNLLSEPYSKSTNLNAEDKSKLFYSTCLNLTSINERGHEPLLELIDTLGGWPVLDNIWKEENSDLLELCSKISKYGYENFLNVVVSSDWRNTSENIIFLTQVTLGLNAHEYYLDEGSQFRLNAYKQLIIEILKLLNVENSRAETTANEIINFETVLANITNDVHRELSLRDHYVNTTLGDLLSTHPKINIQKFLELVFNKTFNLNQPIILLSLSNYNEVFEFVTNSEKRIVTNYLVWRVVLKACHYLGEPFLKVLHKFHQVLTGQKEQKPRWTICVEDTNKRMGPAVGAQYVRNHFDEKSKIDVEILSREIIDALRETVQNIDWIDNETKQKSIEKIDALRYTIGYPNFILSEEKLNEYFQGAKIEKGKHFENVIQLNALKRLKELQNVDKLVDRDEWPVNIAVINAFYETTKNRFVLPAGILQPPIYHQGLPKALNYGAIGAFTGHEITHGFDSSGRQFDGTGSLSTWWSENSIERFEEKTNCFIEQYSNYSIDGKFINGDITKTESIADNGGIRQAFIAYTNWLKNATDEEKEKEIMPNMNLTPHQLYFLGFAQAWCDKIRPETLEEKLLIDTHCPGKFRVIGALANFEEFSKNFNCPLGSQMNPERKCRLW